MGGQIDTPQKKLPSKSPALLGLIMKHFLSLFGLISLGVIIESFPFSDKNINYLSRLIK